MEKKQFYVKLKIEEGKLEKIMGELDEAKGKIYECYTELQKLGLLEIVPEEK